MHGSLLFSGIFLTASCHFPLAKYLAFVSESESVGVDELRIIKDVVLSPEGKVQQGRALLATIRVKNMGEKDEDGLHLNLSTRTVL